jgi:hypothetical protein
VFLCVLTVTKGVTKVWQANWIRADCPLIRWVVETHLFVVEPEPAHEKGYERLCATGEVSVYALMIRMMVTRLAPA